MALGKTVAELDRMPVQEFQNWQRFAAVHPFPADIADIHGAQALALHANINRDPKKTGPFQVSDFLVIRGNRPIEPPRPQKTEAERMRDALMGIE